MEIRIDDLSGGEVIKLLQEHSVAGNNGYQRISLETGSQDFFKAARNLYEKFGFTYCEPFGEYALDPHSQFMTRALKPPAGDVKHQLETSNRSNKHD